MPRQTRQSRRISDRELRTTSKGVYKAPPKVPKTPKSIDLNDQERSMKQSPVTSSPSPSPTSRVKSRQTASQVEATSQTSERKRNLSQMETAQEQVSPKKLKNAPCVASNTSDGVLSQTSRSKPPSSSAQSQPSRAELPSLANFRAQKEQQLKVDLANTQAEAEATLKASKLKTSLQSKGTSEQYLYYERYWEDFIERNKYPNNNVTVDVATRYFMEITAEEADPAKGIYPHRLKRKRASSTTKKGSKSGKDDMPSISTIDMHIKALVNLYQQQCADPNNAAMKLQLVPSPRTYLKGILDAYAARYNRAISSKDVGTIALVETNTTSALKQMMRSCWVRNYRDFGSKKRRKLIGLRDRLDLSWLHFMMSRGETTRMATLPDIYSHKITDPSGGGQFTLGVVLLMLQGKTNKNGRKKYGVVVRNKDVQLCPVGALGFYLYELWSSPQRPDLSERSWTSHHLIFGNDPMKRVSDTAQYLTHKAIMDAANIKDKKKVTHRGHVLGSQYTQACGATVEAIAQHGNWAANRTTSHYLSRVDATVALQMAGFTAFQEKLWLPRNTVIPPIELQRKLFPFIEETFSGDKDWAAWINNIMMDRDVFHGRSIMRPTTPATATPATRVAPNQDGVEDKDGDEDEDDDGDDDEEENDGNSDGDNEEEEASDEDEDGNWDIPVRRHLILLAHLRKVILQDAATLMVESANDRQCPYGEHHIFQDPVFKSQLFYDFKKQLLEQMASATSPHLDSLAANAPSIHQGFQDVSAQIRDSAAHFENLFKSAMEKMDQGFGVIASKMETIDKKIKALEEKTARRINQGSARTWEKVTNALAKTASQPAFEEDEDDEEMEESEEEDEEDEEGLSPATSNTSNAIETPLQGQATQPPPQLSQDTQARLLIETMDVDVLMEKVAEAAIGERKKTGKNWSKSKEMPEYAMLHRKASLDQLWGEWFRGSEEKPSIWEMDTWYSHRWRRAEDKIKSNANAGLYLFKKHIIVSVLKTFPSGMPLKEAEAAALAIVKQRIDSSGSLSLYFKDLPKGKPKK